MPEAVLGKWQAERRSGARIGIADQRQNGMIEGGSGDLDPALFCSVSMRWKNFLNQLALIINYEFLIFGRKSAAFAHQSSDLRLRKKKLVEPGNLRKYLQVGKILGLKIFVG